MHFREVELEYKVAGLSKAQLLALRTRLLCKNRYLPKEARCYYYYCLFFLQEKECENAYFKMDNVLIDDRRIHVDFSQSVAKVKWKGKGNTCYLFITLISM